MRSLLRLASSVASFGLASLGLTACGGGSSSTPGAHGSVEPANEGDPSAFARATNALGLDLFGEIRSEHPGNLALSPASLATALGMTYGGARGSTATAMASGLHVTTGPEDTMRAAGSLVRAWNDVARTDYELVVANRLFGEATYGFAPTFLTATRDGFGAELERVDFISGSEPARAGINRWVSDITHTRIPEILPGGSVTGDTRLVLVNAVYFHGRWAVPFDPSATRDAPFRPSPSSTVNVPTMHRTGGRYAERDGVQVFELPYAGEDLAMLFVLPAEGALDAIEADLDPSDVEGWASALGQEARLEVSLPRFRIETEPMALKAALSDLGMAEIFTDGADFSGMSLPGAEPLFVSDVYHRVFVELNEEGTEAAAATGVVMATRSMPMAPPPRFTADHPFLFFLRDLRTGAILFAGRVADPS